MSKSTKSTPEQKFVPLHGHTCIGSPYDGLGYPKDFYDFAYENGLEALAITDHGNMNALMYQIEAVKNLRKEGKEIKPIYGVEAYFTPCLETWQEKYNEERARKKALKKKKSKKDDEELVASVTMEEEDRETKDILKRKSHLVLLAMNQTGLNNLFRLVSASFKDGFYRKPRIDFKMLEKYNEGIIATSACLGGIIASSYWRTKGGESEETHQMLTEELTRFKNIFGDRFYLEMQWHRIPEQMQVNLWALRMAQELDMQLVSTCDHHYPSPDKWKARELYKTIGWKNRTHEENPLPESIDDMEYELWPMNGDQFLSYAKNNISKLELNEWFDEEKIIESMNNSHHIAMERIEDFYPETSIKLPNFLAKGEPSEELAQAARDGLSNKGLNKNIHYVERLEMELDVIKSLGFSNYFITMKAITDLAWKRGLVGPGRGSGAGSLVNYVLNITQIDPIEDDLQFSRFLRTGMGGYPDIDSDFAYNTAFKDELIQEWGEDSVVPISNFNTMKPKSLIKFIAKYYGIEFSEVNIVTKKAWIEATAGAKEALGMNAGAYEPTYEDVKKYSPTYQAFLEEHPYVDEVIADLVGQVSATSRHAGGVIVSQNISENMPLIASGGVIQTPWSEGQRVRQLEPMGFIKFDILGLSTLEDISVCIEHILKRRQGIKNPTFEDVKKFYDENLHPDVIDKADKRVYQNVFIDKNFLNIFQWAKENVQDYTSRFEPAHIRDLSIITAIFRPGPMNAGVPDKLLNIRKGFFYPEFFSCREYKECTEETGGLIIYQEQIAKVCHKLGKGITLEDGNKIRKLLTKKGTGKGADAYQKYYDKFLEGSIEKGISKSRAAEIWDAMVEFNLYGFNNSHSLSYATISYQCAWLYTYYPVEWACAYLTNVDDKNKDEAIAKVREQGFIIEDIDINHSDKDWAIKGDDTLVQSFLSIKGIGKTAVEYIVDNQPYNSLTEFLLHEDIPRSKVNKRVLSALSLTGALDKFFDRKKFNSRKHFHMTIENFKRDSKKSREDNLEELKEEYHKWANEEEFTLEERISHIVGLTGVYPVSRLITGPARGFFKDYDIKPISGYKNGLTTWFAVVKVHEKTTRKGDLYYQLEVTDETNALRKINIWGVSKSDKVYKNNIYIANLSYDSDFGFSLNCRRTQLCDIMHIVPR